MRVNFAKPFASFEMDFRNAKDRVQLSPIPDF